jgi:hypothetical protein
MVCIPFPLSEAEQRLAAAFPAADHRVEKRRRLNDLSAN